MINRAKCKLCESVIESFCDGDYIECKCGEIAVDGGDKLRCSAKNFSNFIRVDDEGNEIVVKIFDPTKPQKADLIKMLEEMIKNIENLPIHAMVTSINHYDLASALLLILNIFKSLDVKECCEDQTS